MRAILQSELFVFLGPTVLDVLVVHRPRSIRSPWQGTPIALEIAACGMDGDFVRLHRVIHGRVLLGELLPLEVEQRHKARGRHTLRRTTRKEKKAWGREGGKEWRKRREGGGFVAVVTRRCCDVHG